MLFDHIRQHFILDEVFDVEEKIVLVLIQIVEANGTLEPMLDSWKSDGANGAVGITASRWQGLLVFIIIVVVLLLDRLLLGRLLPQERDKPCHQGFIVPEILLKLFFPIFEPLLLTCESEYI
jgi:hypothetical protein